MSFPKIDISKIDDPAAQHEIAKQITDASKQWGFLLVKGHSIPTKDVENMFRLARDFFHLPEEHKAPWPINDRYVGYNAALSDRKKDDKASMWLSGKPGALRDATQALPPYWHEHIEQIEAFKHSCHELVIKLLVCFALAMELPDSNYFADAHAEDAGNGNQFRMIMYPARNDSPPGEATTRMNAHTDSGSVTLLFQTCAGLEVESPTGEWVNAPYLDDHILVNLGDALSFWSGGKLKATKHRVTFNGVPHDQERMSMAYFGAASPETKLEPIRQGSEAVSEYSSNGIKIPPGITVGELSKMIMESIYGSSVKGKATLEPDSRAEITV